MNGNQVGSCGSKRGCWLAFGVVLGAAWILASCRDPRSAPLSPPNPEQVFAKLKVTSHASVTLHTTLGPVHCELDPQRTPRGTSLFLALATGQARWQDPGDGRVRSDPMYRDLTFHRSIPGVMVQSGCPKGDSSGHPGYRIPSETDGGDAARLRTPGAIGLARYTPPPFREDPNPPPPGHVHGSQFFVTLTDMSHLAGKVTVLGHCRDLAVVAALARAVRRDPHPPRLERVEVE